MNAIETRQVGQYQVSVFYDEEPLNPRVDYDNFGTMVCEHRDYNLSDENHDFNSLVNVDCYYNSFSEQVDSLIKNDKVLLALPLYLYDHSGIMMNTTGFSCNWDSGQVGIIYITKEKVKKEFKVKRISKQLKEKIRTYLINEVKMYDYYLTGNCYGYTIKDQQGEILDSCWGYLGDFDYCLKDGISTAESYIKYDIKDHLKKVKQWIKNKVNLQYRTSLNV